MAGLDWKQWTQSASDPRSYARLANNAELFEHCMQTMGGGDFIMHLCLTLCLESDVSPSGFLASARQAWLALRRQIPSIGATITGYGFDLTVTYRVPTEAEADAWARETVTLYEGGGGDIDEARFQLSSRPNPAEGSALGCFVYVVPTSNRREYGVVLVLNHTLFDGTGGKVVGGHYVDQLANALRSGSSVPRITWGDEVKNLLPGYATIMAETELTDEESVKDAVNGLLGDVVSTAAIAHTVTYATKYIANKDARTSTRVAVRELDQETSTRILAACKARGWSVNHVANTALSMVLASNNPPSTSTLDSASTSTSDSASTSTPDRAAHVFWLAINCRDRLRPPYNAPRAYSAFAMCLMPLAIPIQDTFVPDEAPLDERKKRLLSVTANVVQPVYARAKTYPALLASEQELLGMMLGPVIAAGGLPPQTNPLFLADGDAGKQIPSSCPGAFNVKRCVMSVNKRDGVPVCRLHSHGGQLVFNMDYNPEAIPREVVEGWTQAWVDTVSLIL